VPAFGRGVRTGEDKLWAVACGRPVFEITLEAVAAAGCFDLLVVAAPEPRWDQIRALTIAHGLEHVVLIEGGDRRQDSVARALQRCEDAQWVSVHDAARPLAPPQLFRSVLEAAQAEGAAIAGVPCVDTVKHVQDGTVISTLDRSTLVAAQTPQAFAADVLRRAHAHATEQGIEAADDAALVEAIGVRVRVVPGDPRNFKVTVPQDLVMLRALLENGR